MSGRFLRGSEWRKWDLHIHTPDSRLNQGFGGDWAAYLDRLAKSDVAVYGITNYFCFAEDELEKARNGLRGQGSEKAVLGNLEFRISQTNKDNEFVNVHVLFAEHLTSALINGAMARFPLINTIDPGGDRPIYCCDADIRNAGLDFSKILVSFPDLVRHLKQHFKQSDYLVACCPSGYGSFRPAAGDGRGVHLAIEIDKNCDLLLGNSADREFFLKSDRYPGAVRKPVVSGSDAHKFDELDRRYCWIKANPSFGGFRQVLFEPEDRVSLLTDNPDSIYPKPSFSLIEAEGGLVQDEPLAFKRTSLELNPGLIAIIGGRGTGKSVLLDCLFQRFHDSMEWSGDGRLSSIVPKEFRVTFTKQGGEEQVTYDGTTEGALTYLHVRQGDIRKIAENPDALSKEIKRLLGITEDNAQGTFGLDLEAILEQISDIKRWLLREDEQGNRINSKKFNEKIVLANQERIKAITSKENKELVERFNKNAAALTMIDGTTQRLIGLKAKLVQFKQEIGREISTINAAVALYGVAIPEIDTTTQTSAISEIETRLNAERAASTVQNTEIKQQLKLQGIEQDPAGLLDKVSVFQKSITEATQRIEDHKGQLAALKELLKRRREVAAAILKLVSNEREQIETAFLRLRQGKDGWDERQARLIQHLLSDIAISGEVVFDKESFYNGLARVLDGRKFRSSGDISQRERMISKIGVNSFDDFVRLIDGQAIVIGDDGNPLDIDHFALQNEYFVACDEYSLFDYLFLPQWQQQYLGVQALLKYRNKNPDRLSVGQRGTFYICIKLATDPFGSPFVFDQPEDDLDNEFIVRELVPLFREIKQYRQIIVATHNANLVVNADAEQIVVATNIDEQLRYVSGALEDNQIREAVCTILEGGADAFLKRESKYGFIGTRPS